MKTRELNDKLFKALIGIRNKSLTSKDVKILLKEADKIIKERMKNIKNFDLISKIAKKNGITFVTKKEGQIILYGVPDESKDFFSNFINLPEHFNVEGTDYILVFRSEEGQYF